MNMICAIHTQQKHILWSQDLLSTSTHASGTCTIALEHTAALDDIQHTLSLHMSKFLTLICLVADK